MCKRSAVVLVEGDHEAMNLWSVSVKSVLSLFLGKSLFEPSQHEPTPRPVQPKIKYVASADVLIGRTLVGLHAALWSSPQCNLAMFIYELDGDDYMMFPDCVRNGQFECWCVELNESFRRMTQIGNSENADIRLFGNQVVDVLVPSQPEDRVPDSQFVLLSSGYGVSQESGAPIGILPGLYLSQSYLSGMISFRTAGGSPRWP